MKVSNISGEPFRFFVHSTTRDIDFLVDLEENEWKGACGCEDFQFRFATRQGPCKHIRAAQDHIMKLTAHMRNEDERRPE